MSARTSSQCRPGPTNPANARWQAHRRRLIAYGRWQPFVDAEPVREHLRKVMAEGMPLTGICERLNLPHTSSLQHLMYGRGPYGPGHQVRRETAELILAYWPSLDDFPDGSRIDPTGTRRRVQALGVHGWPRHWMARQIGMSESPFKRALNKERVTARIARAVAGLYDEWWNRDPLEYGLLPKSVARVKADAARAGWHGPLAWDDDTIDDPAAVPDLGEKVRRSEALVENARWLMEEHGHTREGAAVRLGVQKASLDQALHRATPVSERPPKPEWTPPRCGEPRMYRQHVARGEDCYVCRGANAAANRRYLLSGSRQEAS